MNVVFRADANKSIGMGHIMRCLSIADAFSTAGCQVEFLIADDGVSKLIRSRGYKAIVLNSGYQKLEDEEWPQDLQPDLIIVDSYYVTATYLSTLLEKMRSSGGKLVYMDDVYAFPYPVDILVDYNAYAIESIYDKLYSNSDIEKPMMVLGSTYAPLRPMFQNIPKKVQKEKVENILISTGGSDELHLALAIIRSLMESSVITDRVYHFLLGAMNSDKESIRELAEKDEHIIIHENVTDMKALICLCDLAISAAGSTLYEISACGVPFITYSLADNQLPGAEAFERLGLAVNIGDLRDPTSIDHNSVMSGTLDPSSVDRIMRAAEKLAVEYEHRCEMGKQMQEMIDGFGADRIVREILDLLTSSSEMSYHRHKYKHDDIVTIRSH